MTPPHPPLAPEELEAIVESAPAAIVVCDEAGRIVLINAEGERLFGYPRRELLGAPIETLVPEQHRADHPRRRQRFQDAPSQRPMGSGRDLHARHRDGSEIPIEIALTPVPGDARHHVVAMAIDLRERKRLEQALRQANEQLETRVRQRTVELEEALEKNSALLRDLEQQRAVLDDLSRRDSLTGLPNRRDFDERLAAEIGRSERHRLSLATAMLDLDHFKRINDRFGHPVGDLVLQTTASLIRRHCRGADILSRFGGEEFALAFPESTLADGHAICERIRCEMEAYPWHELHPALRESTTLSAGIAAWQPGLTAPALMARADTALYAAKRAGRNLAVDDDGGSRGESKVVAAG